MEDMVLLAVFRWRCRTAGRVKATSKGIGIRLTAHTKTCSRLRAADKESAMTVDLELSIVVGKAFERERCFDARSNKHPHSAFTLFIRGW